MVEGRITKRGSYDISVEDVNRAAKLYEESNVKVEAILAKPLPEHWDSWKWNISSAGHQKSATVPTGTKRKT
jgi:hypothetical protein